MTLRFYGEIQRVNQEERIVSGYASTTERAADGLIITREALEGALEGYLRWSNIREMHRPSAVGVTREAEVDDTGMWVDAYIEDDVAWGKVKAGVYKAFSIGARVQERDELDETIIRAIEIVEISLVDRPSDPGATIEVFRADGIDDVERREFSADERKKLAKSGAAMRDGSFPIENKADLKNAIEAYGRAKNKAAAKRHIKARAKALGAEDMLPDSWKNSATRAEEVIVDKDLIERAEEPATEAAAPTETVIERTADVVEPAGGETVGGDIVAEVERTEETNVEAVAEAGEEVVERTEEAPAEAEAVEATVDPLDRAAQALEALTKAVERAEGKPEAAVVPGAEEFAAAVDAIERFGAVDGASLSDEQNEKLNGLLEVLVARGLKVKAVEAAAAGVEEVALERAALVDERDVLKRRLGEFADTMTTLVERVSALEARPAVAPAADAVAEAVAEAVEPLVERMKAIEDTPLPPKTAATSAVAVSKEQDAAGAATVAGPSLSDDELKRALAALPEEERAHILMRAALMRPVAIER